MREYGLVFERTLDRFHKHVALDTAYADDKTTMKSTEGYVFEILEVLSIGEQNVN